MADPLSLIPIIQRAIFERLQMRFTAAGHRREFCPQAVGTTRFGAWRVFGWQFGGESEDGELPDWRCFEVADIGSDIELHPGPWHRGSHRPGAQQTCIEFTYARVHPSFGPETQEPATKTRS